MQGKRSIAALVMAGLVAACSRAVPATAQVRPIQDMRGWNAYLAQAARADLIEDRVARCRAYPDLPGNDWPAGSARARCDLLRTPALPIERITALLASKGGARQLDDLFRGYLDAHYADPAQRDQVFIAYGPFAEGEAGFHAAEKWVAALPDSAFAQTAMGAAQLQLALEQRGGAWTQDTSPARLGAMSRLATQASEHLFSAMRIQPRMSPACQQIMLAARWLGTREFWRDASRNCMQVDPLSWHVRHEWQRGMDPRWGGSTGELARSVEEIRPLVPANPALGGLLARAVGSAAYLPTITVNAPLEAASVGLEEASRLGPDPLYIGQAGIAAAQRGDLPRALGYLSQAMRLAPDDARSTGNRADVRRRMGDMDGAIRDAHRAIALDESEDWYQTVLGQALVSNGRKDEARTAFETAMQSPDLRQWAFKQWCETFIVGKLEPVQAASCTEGLATEYPDDARVLYMRSWVLYATADERAGEVAARFRTLADRRVAADRKMIAELADAEREARREAKEHARP